MTEVDWDEVAQRVTNLLRRDTASGWTLVWDADSAPWFGPFISSLALALGGEEIVFADGRLVEKEDRSFEGDVVFFTANAFVVGRVVGDKLDAYEPTREVRLYSRRDLQLVSVSASGSPFSQAGFREWPGRVEITVRYAPDVLLELPVSRRASHPDVRKELLALLAALRKEANS